MSTYAAQQRALFSSGQQEWETPDEFFGRLHAEFCFTLDAAAMPHNAKVPRFFTREDDGLAQDWRCERVWCNPPYGRGGETARWVSKAAESAARGALAVLLVPARTDTRWFHDLALPHAELRFVRGRLTFRGGAAPAPFPVVVLVFRPALRFGDVA